MLRNIISKRMLATAREARRSESNVPDAVRPPSDLLKSSDPRKRRRCSEIFTELEVSREQRTKCAVTFRLHTGSQSTFRSP